MKLIELRNSSYSCYEHGLLWYMPPDTIEYW